MSSYGTLRVGSLVVCRPRNGVDVELLAVFRDDMLAVTPITARQYYTPERGYEVDEETEIVDHDIELVEYRAPGHIIAARLDLMGVDEKRVLEYLQQKIEDNAAAAEHFSSITDDVRRQTLAEITPAGRENFPRSDMIWTSLDARGWIEQLRSVRDWTMPGLSHEVGSGQWLLDEADFWDDRYTLRAALLARPEGEVVLDISDLPGAYALPDGVGSFFESDWNSLPSDAAMITRDRAALHAPVVVLTEGRTDAEFLEAGMAILYPHLSDLIRFLDYESKPEGGAAALLRMVRAFNAARIANRVVALFDNDTAASEVLKSFNFRELPRQIKVIRCPDLELAKRYPTLGPPTIDSPRGSLSLADVNGLAGSIELYLGRDVLRQADGALRPVQWKSFMPGSGKYQGEVTDKTDIHRSFRAKCALAKDAASLHNQDWDDMRLLLDVIIDASKSEPEAIVDPVSLWEERD